jgi:hypothetical protein
MRTRTNGPARLLGAVAGLALAWAAAAAADETIQGAGVKRTIDCAGGAVTINGTGHDLTLTGRCPRVVVSGTGSVVHVAELGRLTVSGLNQRVEWVKGLDGAEPAIQKSGLGVEVVQVNGGRAAGARSGSSRSSGGASVQAGPAGTTIESDGSRVTVGAGGVTVEAADGTPTTTTRKAGSITVMENDQERTYDCAGGTATIQGNDNVLTLRNCPELVVNGNNNAITLQTGVKLIRALGNGNGITWSQGLGGQAPRIESLGSKNDIKRSGR